jgi:hypothetical protein
MLGHLGHFLCLIQLFKKEIYFRLASSSPQISCRPFCYSPLFALPRYLFNHILNRYLETFTSMINCVSKNGVLVHVSFPELQCWTGMHIIHATFAMVIAFVFIIICLVVILTYFDSQSTSHDIAARVNSRSEVFVIFMKIVLIYFFVFLANPEYQWFIIALLNILSVIAYSNFRNNWPYFNDKMTKFYCVLTGIFLWANFNLLIAKILESTEFSGALQLYFLGLPLIIGLIIFSKDERIELLLKNINNFQRGEDVAL